MYLIVDDLVCREHPQGRTIVIPNDPDLRTDLITDLHDTPLAGHLGAYQTTSVVVSRYYSKGMQADLRRYCQRC